MTRIKSVGIIGAGLSGLVTAKTCLEYGFDITVFEKDKTLGGVWSPSRRYPGLSTQNTKDTYFFSDFPMPAHFDEWPSGEQMHSYLTDYANKFGVSSSIRFEYEITGIDFQNDRWMVVGKKNGSLPFSEQFDFLVVCNGTFSDPFIPPIQGMQGFIDSGGKILHSTQFHSTEISKDKRTVVVGYSKSSGDVVTAAADTAKSTHLVYREAKWKIPRFVNGMNAKYMLLNRLGEAIIKPPDQLNKIERLVHKLGLPKRMLTFMEGYVTKKQKLNELGLRPSCGLKDQAYGEISIEPAGFFEKIEQGKIITKCGEIASFKSKQLTLTTGEQMECDLVIFATGFNQSIPFMPDHFLKQFTDQQDNYILYRHIIPAGVPSLAFVGYNSSLYCSLTSEIAALWVCEYMSGRISKPSQSQIVSDGKEFIQWRSQFRPKGSSRCLNLGPGSIQHVDALLKDMKASLPLFSLVPDWLVTINPARYRKVKEKIIKRTLKFRASNPVQHHADVLA
jgi:dimethylaniline monooxygenase (N-oxide forming)